jgi:hypothetical protein
MVVVDMAASPPHAQAKQGNKARAASSELLIAYAE